MVRPGTVFRLFLYGLLSWLALILLFLSLPCFSRNDDGTNYATEVLKSGGRLARVYGIDDFFSGAIELPSRNDPFGLALTFSVDNESGSLVLPGERKVPLNPPMQLTPQQLQQHQDEGVIVSDPIVVSVAVGDTDGVNPPWFDRADAILLYHTIAQDQALVTLRMLWKNNGIIELWPGPDVGSSVRSTPSATNRPVLTLTMDTNHVSNGSYHLLQSAKVPPPPLSMSPTPTYPVRSALLILLAPTTFLLLGIWHLVIGGFIDLVFRYFPFWVCSVVLVSLWIRRGKPPVRDFARQICSEVKGVAATIWPGSRRHSDARGEQDILSRASADPEAALANVDVK